MPDNPSPRPKGLRFTKRLDHEPPPVATQLGWRFHHVGIPTGLVHPPETHLERFGLHVSGFNTSPYGVEWMRFEADSPLHELIRTVPHVAFEVADLEAALEGQEVISPGSPSEGVRAAMIVHNGAPVELIWFRKAHGGETGQAGQRRDLLSLNAAFNRSRFSHFINGPAGRVFRLVAGTAFLVVGLLNRDHPLGVAAIVWSVFPLSAGAFDLCFISAALGGPLSGAKIRATWKEPPAP